MHIAAAAHKGARHIFTINMATAGALDLKPEVFEGAFSSGVVGALTASQQVTLPVHLPLPSPADNPTPLSPFFLSGLPTLAQQFLQVATHVSCHPPRAALFNSSSCPMLQWNNKNAGRPVQRRQQLAVYCRCCLASLKTNTAPSFSQVLNLLLNHVCPCFCTNLCTSLTVIRACQPLFCLLARRASSMLRFQQQLMRAMNEQCQVFHHQVQ